MQSALCKLSTVQMAFIEKLEEFSQKIATELVNNSMGSFLIDYDSKLAEFELKIDAV